MDLGFRGSGVQGCRVCTAWARKLKFGEPIATTVPRTYIGRVKRRERGKGGRKKEGMQDQAADVRTYGSTVDTRTGTRRIDIARTQLELKLIQGVSWLAM